MKKLLGLLLLPLLFACGTGESYESVTQQVIQAVQPNEADATTTLGNPDPMSVACNTGFVRSAPHICLSNLTRLSRETVSWNAVLATCQTKTWTTIPTSATAVIVDHFVNLGSSNAVALRQETLDIYNSNTCATNISRHVTSIREMVAAVAATVLMNVTTEAIFAVTNQQMFFIVPVFPGNSSASLTLVGYYD